MKGGGQGVQMQQDNGWTNKDGECTAYARDCRQAIRLKRCGTWPYHTTHPFACLPLTATTRRSHHPATLPPSPPLTHSSNQEVAPAQPAAAKVRQGACPTSGPPSPSHPLNWSNPQKSNPRDSEERITLTRFPRNRPRQPWPAMRNWAASPSCRLGGSVPAMAARRSVSKGAVAVRLAAPATPPASRWPVGRGVVWEHKGPGRALVGVQGVDNLHVPPQGMAGGTHDEVVMGLCVCASMTVACELGGHTIDTLPAIVARFRCLFGVAAMVAAKDAGQGRGKERVTESS